MKNKFALLAIVGSTAFATTSQAQGLMGIGAVDEDFESGLPFTTTVSADFGWDSNATSSSTEEDESAYTRAGIDARWIGGNRRTNLTLGASFSTIYYFDGLEGAEDDVFYNARVSLDGRHTVNRRLTVGDNFYLSYEIEPDHAIGESASRRTDNYFYGYNSAWLSYTWNRRFSTIARYTVNGVMYDESEVGNTEDRFTHTGSLEGRYLLNRLTTLVGEYRLSYTDFDSNNRDSLSHYALLGFDHAFSRDLRATVRAGAEFRDSDAYGTETSPYAELALRYATGKHSNLHWITRIGNENSELSSYQKRFSYRSSLNYSQELSQRLRANAGVTYVHNDFELSEIGGGDSAEDLIALNLGLTYRVISNVDLNAGYYFTTVSSDDAFREYDRHRISLGLSTTF
ncbi:MAG: hypothetical protein ACI9UA_001481 [Pseudoalteromonas tetraodonis]|jgi:hypothetical protein